MWTLHFALENGVDLYVNERRRIRHYRAKSTEERKKKNAKSPFFLLRAVRTSNCAIWHSFVWKSTIEHDGGV